MKKKVLFRGCATALVTPFSSFGIDFGALDRLVEEQIAGGVDALVFGGTTGEAATLSTKERYALYRHAVDTVAGRGRFPSCQGFCRRKRRRFPTCFSRDGCATVCTRSSVYCR